MNIIDVIENELKPQKDIPDFEIGDRVKVHFEIEEVVKKKDTRKKGDTNVETKKRIQIFEGVVIAIDNKGIKKNFTVRRISYDVGVERVFPIYSPKVVKIEVVRKGKVRRAKLYHLRGRTGKSAKLKERRGKRALSKTSAEVPMEEPSVNGVPMDLPQEEALPSEDTNNQQETVTS